MHLARVRVVGDVLAQRLADALRRAAVELAAHDHRVDDAADVVHRGVGDDLDGAGRPDRSRPRRRGSRSASSARRRCWSSRRGCAARGCCAASSNRPMPRSVPATWNTPAAIFDVGGGGLQRLGGELAAARRSSSREASCTAEPPMNSEREPALPKPLRGRCRRDACGCARSARRRRRPRAALGWWRCPAPCPSWPRRDSIDAVAGRRRP